VRIHRVRTLLASTILAAAGVVATTMTVLAGGLPGPIPK